MNVGQPAGQDPVDNGGTRPPKEEGRRSPERPRWWGVRALLSAAALVAALAEHEVLAAVMALLAEIGEMIWGPANNH